MPPTHRTLAIIIVVGLIAPYILAMGYSFPVGDDFLFANTAKHLFDLDSASRGVIHAWWNWSGRYTHHFLVRFLGDAVETRRGYMLGTAGVAVVYWLGFFGIFRQTLNNRHFSKAILLSSICMLALFNGHPALSRTFYYFSNTLNINIGNGLVLVFLYAMIRLWNKDEPTFSPIFPPLIVGTLAIGCHEHSAIATLTFATSIYVIACALKRKSQRPFFWLLFILVLVFMVSFLAPGNFARQQYQSKSIQLLLPALAQAWSNWIPYGLGIFRSIWLPTVLALAFVTRSNSSSIREYKLPFRLFLVVGITTFVVLSMSILMLHALSGVPIGRDDLHASLTLLSSYVVGVLIFVMVRHLPEKQGSANYHFIAIPLVILLLFQPN